MFTKLLIPLDGSRLAEQALPTATQLASAMKADLDLVAVHPRPNAVATQGTIDRSIKSWSDADRYIEQRASALEAKTRLAVTHIVPAGEPVECICARAADVGADLIVMTSHGRTGFSRFWMGSVADGVVRRSSIPVLMLRALEEQDATPAARQFRRILVPLDGSKLAEEALGPAGDLAIALDADVVLLHVVHPVPLVNVDFEMAWSGPMATDDAATRLLMNQSRAYLARIGTRLGERGVKRVTEHVSLAGNTATAIIALAKERQVDAIAMSTHGRGVSRLVMGSVADKVMRGSDLPLLIHRPASVAAATLLEPDELDEQLPAVAGRL